MHIPTLFCTVEASKPCHSDSRYKRDFRTAAYVGSQSSFFFSGQVYAVPLIIIFLSVAKYGFLGNKIKKESIKKGPKFWLRSIYLIFKGFLVIFLEI